MFIGSTFIASLVKIIPSNFKMNWVFLEKLIFGAMNFYRDAQEFFTCFSSLFHMTFWCHMHAYLWYDFCLCKLLKIFHSLFIIDFRFFLLHLEKRDVFLFLVFAKFELLIWNYRNLKC
jgi:hypothetical protein